MRFWLDTKKAPSTITGGFAKNGDTYFHAGGHYHRLGKLNFCVRDGNRWDLSDMVAKDLAGGVSHLQGRLICCLVMWRCLWHAYHEP